MTNFLFTWELGANYGHLNRDRQVAEHLRERGHHVLFAVKDTQIATKLLTPHAFEFVQVPLPQSKARLVRPPVNYAELLLAESWGDQLSLMGLVLSWHSLFTLTQADTLIADHSPTALLAAHIAGLPSVAFGNGFEIPPEISPMPSIRPWENIEPARLEQSEKFVLEQMNAVSKTLGGQQITRIVDLFPPKPVLATFAELDHYGERVNVSYTGSVHGIEFAENVVWKSPGGPKILAYLRADQKATEDILTVLAQAGEQAICIVPDIGQSQMRKYASSNLTIYPHPVAISPLLDTADVMISYGGSGTIAESLLAGVPLILIPGVIEQYLGARAVEKLGAGILLGEARDKIAILSAIKKIVSVPGFRQAALCFAGKYRVSSMSAQSAKLAAETILSNEYHFRVS